MRKTFIILCVILVVAIFTSCTNANISDKELIPDSNIVSEDVATETKIVDENDTYEENVKEIEETENLSNDTGDDIITDDDLDISIESVIDYSNKKLLASNSTTFNPNLEERSTNVRLAASHINGIVLNPNDEFSFNKIVGERTTERGFLPADIFSGNSVVKGIGGGICQTSSTVCGAVRKTSMKILEQNPHSMRVTYTTIENEAMISYGSSDFRFVNTYDFPIMIEISFQPSSSGEIIKCDIFALE